MSSEAGPLRWYGHNFEGVAIPESGGAVTEEARLRLAPSGVYEIVFRQEPRYEFNGTLLFNGAKPQPHTGNAWQFQAVEDISGTERTLMIQSAEGALPFESLEIIPLDYDERPLDVTRLDIGARQSTVRYRKDALPESLKIRFSGINVFDFVSVAACLWTHGQPFTSEPLAAFITRPDAIRVDRLGHSKGETRKLEGHLQALFDVLLDFKAPVRVCSLECRYQYPVAPDGPAASIPILFISARDFGNETVIFSTLEDELRRWFQATEPSKGDFVFEVTLYDTWSRETAPALRLTQLLLPTESIADWQ